MSRLQKKLRLNAIRDSQIDATSVIEGGSQVVGTTMDRHSFCGYDCTLLNVDIGGFCSISDQVFIGGSAHPAKYVSTSPVFLSHRDSVKHKFALHEYYEMPRTTIGHDVWIGFAARIKAGVSVGHGAIVGMGAVVTRDVEPYTIVGGNPAHVIRSRFSSTITKALLKSEWWAYSAEELGKCAICFDDPEEFLRQKGLL